jgi:hypothetical protein
MLDVCWLSLRKELTFNRLLHHASRQHLAQRPHFGQTVIGEKSALASKEEEALDAYDAIREATVDSWQQLSLADQALRKGLTFAAPRGTLRLTRAGLRSLRTMRKTLTFARKKRAFSAVRAVRIGLTFAPLH